MYTERKRKQQLFIYPRTTSLTAENAYGKRLLEKMGWSEGKGLGVDLHGMKEPLKMTLKNDNKGLGFQESEDHWVENQRIFDKLLLEMNGGNRENDSAETVTSLEQQSMRSRSRLNYRKFTRGKDLSKCNEKDLASILGMSKSISVNSAVESNTKSELVAYEPEESNERPLCDYSEFSSGKTKKKRKIQEVHFDDTESVDNFSVSHKKKKKSIVETNNLENFKSHSNLKKEKRLNKCVGPGDNILESVKGKKNKHKIEAPVINYVIDEKMKKKKEKKQTKETHF